VPQFAELLARGSCAVCPTELAGHFCFLGLSLEWSHLLSGESLDLKNCAPNCLLRHVAAALLLCATAVSAPAHAEQSSATSTPKESFRTVSDETGRSVRIPVPVRRVVSLAPSLTESIYALGMDELLVGDTDYCDYPGAAKKKHKVGGATNPSLEEIAALKPDLVLVTKGLNRLETVQELERLGIAAYATDPHTVDEIRSSVRRLAEILGNPAAGDTLDRELTQQEAGLQQRLQNAAPKRVLFVVWTDPLISVGRHTFIADALVHAGAVSVVESSQDWPQMSLEEMVRLQPEYLVFASGHSEAVSRDVEALARRPGWDQLEAVKHRRFAVISDAVNRPAPRLFTAVEELARQLHPEAFANKSESSKAAAPAEKN
jgi:iron complex transport system substrate-binding protein